MATTREQLNSIQQARRNLGQIETIEGLLEFDLTRLIVYADQSADVRQKLVRSIFAVRLRRLTVATIEL